MRPKLLFRPKEASALVAALQEAADRAPRGCLAFPASRRETPPRFCSANWNRDRLG